MPSRYVPAFLVCLALLLTCRTLLAASCQVVLENPEAGAVLLNHGKELPLKDNATQLSDCSQLTLVRGIVHVLYETQNGVTRKTCKVSNTSCNVDAGKWPSWLDLFKYQGRPGGKKMDEAVPRLPGIPYGKVFSLERAATFNLSKAGLTQWNLTLIETGGKTPIYRKPGSDPVAQVPSNLLRRGGKYTVLIDAGPQKYKGGFDLLGGAEAADIAEQIKQATTNAGATARAKKLDELIIYYENNLDYEVELLREELKL
jgi:hypothetical protein